VTVKTVVFADANRSGATDPKDVRQRNFQPLVAGNVDTGDTCHRLLLSVYLSALALLMARVLTDHSDPAVATNHTALFTHLFDARSDLHCVLLSLVAIRDTTSGEVVWGEFHLHLVAREDSDVVHPHLS